jgi:isoquinoline 1-oxidoreductase
VTAPDPLAAQAALDAIDAHWRPNDEGPAEAALEAHLRTHPVEEQGWAGNLDRRNGDPERAFASAERIFSATYRTAYIAHMPLETRAAVAEIDTNGRLTVWTGTQRPFGVRQDIAEALEMDEADIRVIVPPTGSGYGGKHGTDAAIEAARLAKATKQPVKVRWTRAEEFRWAYFRPAAVIDIRSAVDREGRITAWEHVNINSGPNAISPPYVFLNSRLRYQAADSPLRQGSWRALAASANTFARESHIDEIVHELAVHPVDFRLRHLKDDRLAAVLKAAADRVGDGPGVGIALGFEKDGRVASAARVREAPGSAPGIRVEKVVTAYDCGLIVDRDNLANQIEGAAVMGLSQAMFEQIHFAERMVTTDALAKYRVARFSDTPEIEVVLLDQPAEPMAGGGETPLICIAPAIANAIFAATGWRIRSLPLLAAD